jgi:hypothetical protein
VIPSFAPLGIAVSTLFYHFFCLNSWDQYNGLVRDCGVEGYNTNEGVGMKTFWWGIAMGGGGCIASDINGYGVPVLWGEGPENI